MQRRPANRDNGETSSKRDKQYQNGKYRDGERGRPPKQRSNSKQKNDRRKEGDRKQDRDREREKEKERDRIRQKERYREREREREREKEKEKQRARDGDKRQAKERQLFVSKGFNSKSKSRQNSRDRERQKQRERSRERRRKQQQQRQQQQALIKQKRLAMARLLMLDDSALDIAVDNNQEQPRPRPPPQKVDEKKVQIPKEEQKMEQKPMVVQKPKTQNAAGVKKKSRWEKSSSPTRFQMIQFQPIVRETVPKPKQNEPDSTLNLSVQDDPKINQSMEVEEESKPYENINHGEQDDLDAYMKQIQGLAVPQLQLTQAGRQTCITYQDIVTANIARPPVQKMQIEQQQESDKFKNQFMKAFDQMVKAKDAAAQNPNEQDQTQVIGDIIQGQEEQESEDKVQDDDDNFLDKQKRLAERKQYHQIDHQSIKYQQVRFNLYRQAEEIQRLTKEEVDKYRKEAGDIKVRGRDILNPVFNWYQCGLSDKVLEVIQQRKYKKPFPIQAQSFPLMMSGRDVIGIAETGSGKTMAYMIPVIRHIEEQRKVAEGEGPIALIMTPTRELARQVYAEFKAFCKPIGIRVISVYGGLGMQTQLSDLRKGAEVIICTPGRMIDVLTLNNGKITNLRRVSIIVIDEADRMFDLGFEPQITKLLNNIRPVRQTVMFSATFPKNVEILAKKILKRPAEIIVGSRGQACVNIEQIIEVRDQTSKLWRLLQILGQWYNKGSILIFVDKKTEVDFLFKELLKYGYHSLPLHSGMDATDREFNVHDFRKGIKSILVATSICSRGLDIKNIVLVVNFKCPDHLEDYIHRIGRTGRAGNKGTAITFITPQEEMYSVDMIKALEMADKEPSEELLKLQETYYAKLKKGEAKKIRNRNRKGGGYKFNEDQQDNDEFYKDIIKKQFKSQGLQAMDDSDEQDIERQKKRQQDKRGRSDKEKTVEALKDPELKQKLLIETAKALNDAINQGQSMTTEKIIKLAVQKMKQEATKHVIVRTAQEGQQRVLQLIDEMQKTNPEGPTFSYDFEINDYPLNARSKVTAPKFLKQIKDMTFCTVSSRGQYFEPGKKVPHGSRKLYMHIQGQNKSYVSAAYKEIKRALQDQSAQNYQGQLALKYGMM